MENSLEHEYPNFYSDQMHMHENIDGINTLRVFCSVSGDALSWKSQNKTYSFRRWGDNNQNMAAATAIVWRGLYFTLR